MTMRKTGPFIILISLVAGSLIYFITRTETTIINHWLSAAGYESMLLSFQGLIDNAHLPHWVIYSLPDALWMLAMSLSILVIWGYQINFTSISFTLMATAAGAGHELLQAAGIIRGTYDIVDLIFMVVAGILPLAVIVLGKFIPEIQKTGQKSTAELPNPSDIIIET